MLNKAFLNQLNDIYKTCEFHAERMMFAYNKLEPFFPLTEKTYKDLTAGQISFTDQLIFRFSKLQDTIGNRLFRIILEGLEEDVTSMPFVDILNKLEKLDILEDHHEWLLLRETRNQVAHEYPFKQDEMIEGLNELYKQAGNLLRIWQRMKNFIEQRFYA